MSHFTLNFYYSGARERPNPQRPKKVQKAYDIIF